MRHTYTPLDVPRFATIGATVIFCGRDVYTYPNAHDAAIAASVLCEVFSSIDDTTLYNALFTQG